MKSKKLTTLIVSAVLCVSLLVGNNNFQSIATAAQVNVNLIKNGNFDKNLDGWGSYAASGGSGKISLEDGAIKTQVNNCWHCVLWSSSLL